MAWHYGDKSRFMRRALLNAHALTAEFDVPDGRIGQVVRQLRRRGMIATNRAWGLLSLLVLVVFAGITYYLAIPIWLDLQNAERRALSAQLEQAQQRMAGIDGDRDVAWNDLAIYLDQLRRYVTAAPREFTVDAGIAGSLILIPGPSGDEAIIETFDGFSEFTRQNVNVRLRFGSVRALIDLRQELSQEIERLRRALESMQSGQVPPEQRIVLMQEFLAACVAALGTPGNNAADAATVQHCTSVYASDQDRQRLTVWEILADRLPAGFLLLFLLVTLGGLYRYNMRLASFHHSRADLLELLAIGRGPDATLSPEDWQSLRESAAAMAADMVEFGTSKAGIGPQGVSFELSRLKPGQ